MKKYLILFFFSISYFIFSQEMNLNKIFKNENLAKKINVISKFIDKSSTIHYNDYNSEPILITMIPINIEYNNDRIKNLTFDIIIQRLNAIKEISNEKCFKISDDKYFLLSPFQKPIKGLLNNYDSTEYDCNKVLPRSSSKNEKQLPQSFFTFYLDENGNVYLYELATFDPLEYLNLEYVDINEK